MKNLNQWVCWDTRKCPFDPKTGRPAKANDSTTWADFETARRYAAAYGLGIGFEFSAKDPYIGVDIDKCRDPNTGELNETARHIVHTLQSYTEISPSGTGVHIICRGALPPGGRRKGPVEMYDSGRYFTMTGHLVEGTPLTIEERTAELAFIHSQYIAPLKQELARVERPQFSVSLSDAELIQKILRSKSGPDFERLLNGDTSKYNGDDSAADQALANMLAFWTGRDAVRMDSLFRQSRLYREKWDERHFADGRTYGEATINKAIADCKATYDPVVYRNTAVADFASTAEKPKYFNRTDAGNAELLAHTCGDQIRFCFEYGKWLIFDGKRWATDEANQIFEFAKKTMRAAHASFQGNEEAQKFYRSSESKAKLAAAVYLAQTLLPIKQEELDADNWLLNVQNGVVDLRNGNLLPHDPKYFMTKICRVDYIPNAPAPFWQDVLAKIIPDPSVRAFVQRFAGYSLTGSTREEKFLVLNGEGGTGKGTVTETLAYVLADYADTLSTDVLLQSRNASSGNEPTPEIAKLPAVRLLLASETGQGRMLDEARVKALTGGDRVTCRRLRCDPFTFKPNFKLWLSTNHVPRVRGTDEGVWRRIRLVPFDQQFKDGQNRDNTIKERLHDVENLRAVLAWAVQGCLEWQRIGLNEPPLVLKSTNDFRQECDLVEQFLSDECEKGPNHEAPVRMFYQNFRSWAVENGHIPGSSTTFGRLMEAKGYSKVKKMYGWVWPGVRLNLI